MNPPDKPLSNREIFYKYKGNRCGHCGKSVDEMIKRWGTFKRVFQLNHIDPSKKSGDYDNLIRRVGVTHEQLDELDKCVLLCVECHQALHAQNVNVEMEVKMETEGQTFAHTLDGQLLFDGLSHKVTFFTDQLDDIFLYRVRLGDQESRIYAGYQLKENDTINRMVKRTREEGPMIVTLMDDTPMLRASRKDDLTFEMEPNINFPLVKADLRLDEFSFFVRSGVMITSTGNFSRNFTYRVTISYANIPD